AHQWRKPEKDTRRGAQRLLLRERLSPELHKLLERHGLLPREPANGRLTPDEAEARNHIVALLAECGTTGVDDDEDPRYFELRRLLAQLAASELRDLQRSVRWHRTQPGSLTPLSVKLTAAAVHLRSCYVDLKDKELQPGDTATPTSSLDWEHRPEIADS